MNRKTQEHNFSPACLGILSAAFPPVKARGQARITHGVRHETAETPRETSARSREAGLAPPGSSEGGAPPSWGFYKGAGPLVRVGEAGFWAEPTREGGILEAVC